MEKKRFYKEVNGEYDVLTKRKIPSGEKTKPVLFDKGEYQIPENSDWSVTEPSPEGLRKLLKEKNLTGNKAATIVGVHGRTVRKWTGGERGIPAAAWKLLIMYRGEKEK